MIKLLAETRRIICIAGFILLCPVAGSAQPETQWVDDGPRQAAARPGERQSGARVVEPAGTATRLPISEVDIGLTEEEEAWLAAQPEIVLGASTEYSPLVLRNADGAYSGVVIDLFEQLNRRLNNKIRLHVEDPWIQVQERARNRELDGLAIGGRSPSREVIYDATDVVFSTYFSVFSRSRHSFDIRRFSDLDGLRIGYKKGAAPTRDLLEKLPSAILVPYDSHEAITQGLLSEEIDVVIAWLSYDFWIKQTLQGTVEKIFLIDEHPMDMVIHIRDDRPGLVPILNKAIADLRYDELPWIFNKWFGQSPRPSVLGRLTLTPEEQAWLNQGHTVRVRVGDHPPWVINTPEPAGMAIDYLTLIGERTGIDFRFIVDEGPWIEGFEDIAGEHKRFDLYPTGSRTPERLERVAMSEDYLSSPRVIFTREETPTIFGIEYLRGKKVAVERGYVMQKELSQLGLDISLVLAEDTESALKTLSTGAADAYVGNLIVTSHILQRLGIDNVKVAAPAGFPDHRQAMATRKEWAPLMSIIDKAFGAISEEEKISIRNKYLPIVFERGIDRVAVVKWILLGGGISLTIVLVIVVWNRRLVSETAKRKDAEAKLLTTFDSRPIAAVMIDKDDSMYLHNRRFRELTGYTLAEIPHLADWWVRAYPDPDYRRHVIETWNSCLQRSKETGQNIEAREYKVTCKNGDVRELEISGHYLGDRYLATLTDNTEQNRAQGQLVNAKEAAEAANRAKSVFLANMSHELRTPLNAILGFSRRLARDRNTSQNHRDNLSLINRSGEYLLSMINEILDLSKIEQGREQLRLETFDLRLMLAEIVKVFEYRASEAGLQFDFESDDELPQYIETDRGKLYNILLNLLSNAVKHTRKGGVSLRVRILSEADDAKTTWLRLEVEDTGEGIASEEQPRIFDAFYQAGHSDTDGKGSGLGLAIIKSYLEMMAGRVSVESAPGRGSLFRVEVPVALANAPDATKDRPAGQNVLGLASGAPIWRIVVEDDNRDIGVQLSGLLGEKGFEGREVPNGEQAVALFQQWRPHLIWMDMRMPVVDGYEAVRRIRRLPDGDAVKMVAITASAFYEQRQQILAAGCDEVIYKPFRDDEILDTMARLLGVRYRYEDPDADTEQTPAPALTREMLTDLPSELRQDLSEAALVLDMEAIANVIQRIRALAPETARCLQTLVQDFQLDRVRRLLNETRLQSEMTDV